MSGAAAGNTATPERPADAGADSSERRLPTWWGRFVESRRKRHTPGLWVIYLSFIALPVFGLLHGMIDDADTRRQQHVFKLLVVYVASAMALLMTTSFLGLRRYLRQRRLEMPLDMAGTWLGVGGAMTVALLVFASLLPRPTATENVIDIAWRLTSPDDHEPSKMGQGKDGVDKEGPASDTEKGGKTANEGKAEKGESSEAGDKGQDGSKGKESQQASEKGSRPEASPPSAPILSNLMEMLGTLLKWLLLAAVIAGGIYWAYKNREMVVAAWRKFLQELRDFWNRLFGRRGTDAAPAEATPVAGPSAKPFALFDNPFATGMAERLSPDELVKYSFEAMEAWAREHGCERKEQQTPHEFGREVARQNGSMAAEAVTIAELYSRVAYAKGSLTKAAVKHVEQLWSRLGSTPA